MVFFRPAIAEQGERTVLVLLSADTNANAEALSGIQATLRGAITIRYVDDILSRTGGSNLEDYFASEESERFDLILTVGPRATREALEYVRAQPVVFTMLHTPKSLGPAISRACGVAIDVPPGEFFRTLKELQPDAKRVYAFYSSEQGRLVAMEGEFTDLRHNIYYTAVRVANGDALRGELNRVRDDVDAIFVVPDPLYDRANFSIVSDFSRENGIVLMTGFASLLEVGATFAITPDHSNAGQITGRMADRILGGQSDCSTEGIVYPGFTSFYLNDDFAASQGLDIPETMKERARVSGLLRAGVELYRQARYQTALTVFDAILARDPANENAQAFRGLALDEVTGNRTRDFTDRARQFMAARNYAAALNQYRQALNINANHPEARAGYQEARRALSQQEQQSARALAANGRPFEALRRYQSALNSMPENAGAAREMAALRANILPRVDGLLSSAIAAYTDRRYDEAIAGFENILLVQPQNGEAREYLRLSRRKKEALDARLRE